ncbi:TetR family transcriptional regulator [Microterricola gilva]|uniref:TetR family transcriptional regulator n=1 Tax=Microterricola gilva TaxID=393267 RepID=A0A4Q8AMF7_9MICO|nr:TetR family transcriptional regulator [Microterricola gilva]
MVERNDSPIRPTTHARVRILDTANRLFYDEGVHTVGINRIIAEARVTKTTFYKYYPSKDLLIVAYLRVRDDYIRDILTEILRTSADPLVRLELLVDAIAGEAQKPDFRGCPFINATAQFSDPAHPVREAIARHRQWYGTEVEALFRDAGHPSPGTARDDYFLARDGAYASANLGDPVAAQAALRRAMGQLIEQASAGGRND